MTKNGNTLQDISDRGLGCRSYLYNEINAGRLRAIKRGRRTIVLEEDLQTWLAKLPAVEPKRASALSTSESGGARHDS